MAGHVEDARLFFAEGIGIAVADVDVEAGNAVAIGTRTDDGAAGRLLDLAIAAGVVVVMMPSRYAASRIGAATLGSTTPVARDCGSWTR
jgi:hypothetical protein